MREPPLEAVGHQEPAPAAAREGLHQQAVPLGKGAAAPLQPQPLPDRLRQRRPAPRVVQDGADASGEPCRQRHARPGVGGHARVALAAARDDAGERVQRLEPQRLAGEDEAVAGLEGGDEPLLHVAQHRAAAQPHLDHRRFDDGAEIHPELPRHPAVAHVHQPLGVAEQLAEAVVAPQRVAAVLDEAEHVVEVPARQRGVGRGARHLGVEVIRTECGVAGGGEDVLREHVQPARPGRVAVQLLRRHGLHRRGALDHLEAVGGDEHGAGGLVHAVVGAAHALQQAGDALGRAHLNHLVHVAPVDAEVEGGGGDHGAQPARGHRRLHLAALLHRQAAVVQRNGQVGVVQPPERLEHQLRLRAGVDEHDGDARVPDAAVDLRRGSEAHVPAPGQVPLRQHDRELWPGAAPHLDQADPLGPPVGREVGAERPGVGDGGREADAPRPRRERRQPRQPERELVAALGAGQRVNLVHDHGAEAGEQRPSVGEREQQR